MGRTIENGEVGFSRALIGEKDRVMIEHKF